MKLIYGVLIFAGVSFLSTSLRAGEVWSDIYEEWVSEEFEEELNRNGQSAVFFDGGKVQSSSNTQSNNAQQNQSQNQIQDLNLEQISEAINSGIDCFSLIVEHPNSGVIWSVEYEEYITLTDLCYMAVVQGLEIQVAVVQNELIVQGGGE